MSAGAAVQRCLWQQWCNDGSHNRASLPSRQSLPLLTAQPPFPTLEPHFTQWSFLIPTAEPPYSHRRASLFPPQSLLIPTAEPPYSHRRASLFPPQSLPFPTAEPLYSHRRASLFPPQSLLIPTAEPLFTHHRASLFPPQSLLFPPHSPLLPIAEPQRCVAGASCPPPQHTIAGPPRVCTAFDGADHTGTRAMQKQAAAACAGRRSGSLWDVYAVPGQRRARAGWGGRERPCTHQSCDSAGLRGFFQSSKGKRADSSWYAMTPADHTSDAGYTCMPGEEQTRG